MNKPYAVQKNAAMSIYNPYHENVHDFHQKILNIAAFRPTCLETMTGHVLSFR